MFEISGYNLKNNKNLYFESLPKTKVISMNNCAETFNKLNELYITVERAVPEYGSFSTVKTKYQNKVANLDINDITISVKPSILLSERPKERELEIVVNSNNNLHKYSYVLKRGDKKELLEYLQKDSLPYEIEQILQEASEKFKEISL